MIYLISDTHFGHKNIIEYANRNFYTIDEMNEIIISNWNKTISNKDTVYHLGDFALGKGNFKSHSEYIEYLLSRLNGKKVLIKGNHDPKSSQWYMDRGFKMAIDGGIILEEYYLLTHKPIIFSGNFINIHGHTHQNNMRSDSCFNVSVEQINYTPILFDKIKNKFDKSKNM